MMLQVETVPLLSSFKDLAFLLMQSWTWFAFLYTIILQVLMMTFVWISRGVLRRPRAATRSGKSRQVVSSALPAGVSAIMPAYNEENGIVTSVKAMLQLSYPLFEVIVVNDGSKDTTLEKLVEAFDLLPIEHGTRPYPELTTNPVKAVWVPKDESISLRVIDKEAGGTKAYAVNAGVAAANYPWVVVVDADSIVAPDAVTHVLAEVSATPYTVMGAGGTVLPINDCLVEDGEVKEARVPRKLVAAFQLTEYLRSFVVGRAAFGAVRGVAIISGAFGVFRRSEILAIGGYTSGHLGEDLDLAVRLQRRAADNGLETGLLHVPEAVLWTEVPESLAVLKRQRTRWHRGLKQVIKEHKVTIGNLRFGRFGSLGMTFLYFFEYLAPLVEGTGYLVLLLAVLLDALNLQVAFILLAATFLAGFTNTAQAIYLEQHSLALYTKRSDLFRVLFVGFLEQFGYRQLTVYWRLKAMFFHKEVWGAMERKGLANNSSHAKAIKIEVPALALAETSKKEGLDV